MSRPIAILVPRRAAETYSGGHLTQLRLAETLASLADVMVIEYDIRRAQDAVERYREVLNVSFVICGVGSHIERLAALLTSERVVYWANSVGWFNSLDSGIPILAASRYTLGYLGEICPASFLAYLPNPLSDEFTNERRQRTIDVLVQRRRCSRYVLDVFVPELGRAGLAVTVLNEPPRTRTPTVCSANTSRRAPISPAGASTTSSPSKTPSTAGPERFLAGRPPPKPSTSSYCRPTKQVLQRLVEPGQYTSWAFTRRALDSGLVPSMGSIGDCYDNGQMESFLGTDASRAAQPQALEHSPRVGQRDLRVP